MLVILYLLLMLRTGRCTDDQSLEIKTVALGHSVRLSCSPKSWGNLFWIRFVSGKLPEVLGKSFNSDSVDPRITTTEDPGSFALRIIEAKLSDAGVYYCLSTQSTLTFLKGAELRVEGPEPGITAVPLSDPVCPGDSVTLQCSVFSDSESKTCPGNHSVCCLRVGSHQFQPSDSDIQGNSEEEYKKDLEGLSKKKNIYSFSMNISSSDAGNYYCAAASCKETVSKPDNEAVDNQDSQDGKSVIFLLCAALAVSLIVMAFLIYSIKKLKNRSCSCCNAAVALQTNAATASVDHQCLQTDEDSLVYSAVIFTSRESGKSERRDAKSEEEESIYTDVRAPNAEIA